MHFLFLLGVLLLSAPFGLHYLNLMQWSLRLKRKTVWWKQKSSLWAFISFPPVAGSWCSLQRKHQHERWQTEWSWWQNRRWCRSLRPRSSSISFVKLKSFQYTRPLFFYLLGQGAETVASLCVCLCRKYCWQSRPGVILGTFIYSFLHSDSVGVLSASLPPWVHFLLTSPSLLSLGSISVWSQSCCFSLFPWPFFFKVVGFIMQEKSLYRRLKNEQNHCVPPPAPALFCLVSSVSAGPLPPMGKCLPFL